MPVVFRESGHRFFFYSNEGDPREPVHIHVTKDGNEAKFWLYPDVTVAYSYGFSGKNLAALAGIISAHGLEIEEAWNDHFT
jgi:Domain of unknown function (DUF4160)